MLWCEGTATNTDVTYPISLLKLDKNAHQNVFEFFIENNIHLKKYFNKNNHFSGMSLIWN